mmetsp:Transcript_32830/g.86705  ORF Transcript_32830/g.86705 Transcript_32830/m.86705 type:complete len:198 (+) Transcript_32830:127-720(+)
MSWDRGAPTPVVQNAHQAKQEPDQGPPWFCPCSHTNSCSASHCVKCGLLRPEERAMRLQARAIQGLGRGGGYYERSDPSDRREVSPGRATGEIDEFGRRRSAKLSTAAAASAPAAEEASPASAPASSGPKNAIAAPPAPPSKAERQKAALDRLRNPKGVKAALSPPRTRTFREMGSRSRSREKKKKQKGFILSGGIG